MMLRILVVVSLAGCAGRSQVPGEADLVTTELDVTADDGLQCHVYVSAPPHPTTVMLWLGGTGIGSLARIPEELVQPGVALVTFDKPGVRAPFGDPNAVRIVDATFARHTQGTLLSCAHRALAAVLARVPAPTHLILRGHSEGTLIMLGLYESLDAETAARVNAVVLSGLPVEPFGVLLRRQLADRPLLAHAIETCDWPTMKRLSGVSCAYIADADKRPSGRELIERLVDRCPEGRPEVDVFVGTEDTLTPAHFVTELEAWNAEHGHLDLHVYRYAGEHGGTDEAHRMVAALVQRLVNAPARELRCPEGRAQATGGGPYDSANQLARFVAAQPAW
jgi:hypothetical protein